MVHPGPRNSLGLREFLLLGQPFCHLPGNSLACPGASLPFCVHVPFLLLSRYTYYHKAEVCLGLQSMLGLPGYVQAVKLYGHGLKSQYKAVDAAVRYARTGIAHDVINHITHGVISRNDVTLPTALSVSMMCPALQPVRHLGPFLRFTSAMRGIATRPAAGSLS